MKKVALKNPTQRYYKKFRYFYINLESVCHAVSFLLDHVGNALRISFVSNYLKISTMKCGIFVEKYLEVDRIEEQLNPQRFLMFG